MATRKRKPQPSETTAAREAHGRTRVQFSLPIEVVDMLDALAHEAREHRSPLVADLIREAYRKKFG